MSTRHIGNETEVRALDTYIKLIRAADSVGFKALRPISAEGITPTQFAVMEALYHLGPLHQCEIANKLLKSGANITLVLDNLEKQGWITRERDPQDRRSTTVQLTDDGRQTIEKIFPGVAAFITRQLSALEPDEQLELGRLCRKLGLSIVNNETIASS